MKLDIADFEKDLFESTLQDHGVRKYILGGLVRDRLLGIPCKYRFVAWARVRHLLKR